MEYFTHQLPEGNVTYFVVKVRDIEEPDNISFGKVLMVCPPLPEVPSQEWCDLMETVLVGYVGQRTVAEALNDEGFSLIFEDTNISADDAEVVMLNKFHAHMLYKAAVYGHYNLKHKIESGIGMPDHLIKDVEHWNEAINEYAQWLSITV